MNPAYLLRECRRRGVALWAEDGLLRYRGPSEGMSPEFLDCLRQHKGDLLRLLAQGEEGRETGHMPEPCGQIGHMPEIMWPDAKRVAEEGTAETVHIGHIREVERDNYNPARNVDTYSPGGPRGGGNYEIPVQPPSYPLDSGQSGQCGQSPFDGPPIVSPSLRSLSGVGTLPDALIAVELPPEPESSPPLTIAPDPVADPPRSFRPARWRCQNAYCFHGSRWWMSRWHVINCFDCRPPAFPGLVVSSGDLSDAPEVEPGRSNQAIGYGPLIGGAGSPVPSPRDAGSDAPEDLVARAAGWLEGYLLRERAEVGQLIADGVKYGLTEAALRAAVGPAGLRVVEQDGVTYWALPY